MSEARSEVLPDSEAKVSGSVVRRSNHHCGRYEASSTVPAVSLGGTVMPLRVSRSRRPATAVSTVTSRVSKPLAHARSMSARDASWSRHR